MSATTEARLLPIVTLCLAIAQGLALLGLHEAIDRLRWPATNLAILAPLYLNVILVPLTAQLLARFFHERRLLWALLLMVGVLTFVGWHFGANVVPSESGAAIVGHALVDAVPLVVLWLIAVAFLRAQLETGANRPPYNALFAAAWRNKLVLLEVSVFVGAVWLLLVLWALLFDTLEIRFFSELFYRPAFFYPATMLVIAIALHLIGSIDRIVDVVLAQVLGLFKWLAPLAGLIVVLFTIALLPNLPRLLATDERPLDSDLLLWLVAVTVLLFNAAYGDGSRDRPYGAVLSFAMRVVPPLLTLIALTATYSLYVRIDAYGVTVSRFWGFFTACIALVHAAAASLAAVRSGPWMGYTSKSNPVLAFGLAIGLLLAVTPVLSPYRLSAASQQRIAVEAASTGRLGSALTYLRFSAGGYGREALQALAEQTSDIDLAASAEHTLRTRDPGNLPPQAPLNYDAWRGELRFFPAERPVPAALEQALRDAQRRSFPDPQWSFALWADVVGGPELELFVSLGSNYELYAEANDGWRMVSRGFIREAGPSDIGARDIALARGDFATVPADLPDLRIGERRIGLIAEPGFTPQ